MSDNDRPEDLTGTRPPSRVAEGPGVGAPIADGAPPGEEPLPSPERPSSKPPHDDTPSPRPSRAPSRDRSSGVEAARHDRASTALGMDGSGNEEATAATNASNVSHTAHTAHTPSPRPSRAQSRDRSSGAETAHPRDPRDGGSTTLGISGAETADDLSEPARHDPLRRCILSGDHGPRDRLIRLALGPDGMIAPDVRARAPGRGAWIGVDRDTLTAAAAKGRLKGALYRAFKTQALAIPDDLPDRIEVALRRDALDRLGLEARSGTLLTGTDKIADAARKAQVRLLIHAADASPDGNRKLDQAWRMGMDAEGSDRRGLVIPADRHILAMALGRENVVHIALITPAAAARVSLAIDRWRGYIGRDWATAPCDMASQGPSALKD